jgi:hypothetical protein
MADHHDLEKGANTTTGTNAPLVAGDRNGAGPSGTGAVGRTTAGTGAGEYTPRPTRIADAGALFVHFTILP